jgi:hypothetical protein
MDGIIEEKHTFRVVVYPECTGMCFNVSIIAGMTQPPIKDTIEMTQNKAKQLRANLACFYYSRRWIR